MVVDFGIFFCFMPYVFKMLVCKIKSRLGKSGLDQPFAYFEWDRSIINNFFQTYIWDDVLLIHKTILVIDQNW